MRSTYPIFLVLAVLLARPVHAQVTVGTGNATGTPSVAISAGATANATNTDTIAVGRNSNATGVGATAIGSSVTGTNASGNDSIAIGAGANSAGLSSTAIGLNASATAQNAVAIGTNSVANQANTVSVGSAGNERRVTNVASGVNATDAVNVSQLNAVAIGGAGPQVDALTERMGTLESRVDDLTRNAYRGIAGAAALAGSTPMAPGRFSVNIGAATYQGYSALAATVGYLAPDSRFNVSGGFSQSGGKPIARASVGFSF